LSSLKAVEHVFPDVSEYVQRIEESYIELKDLAQDINTQLENIDFDPSELDIINNRLDRLYDLEKKYHVETVDELIEKRDELKRQLSNIENSDEALADLELRMEKLERQARQEADILTKLRVKASKQIEKEMQAKLVPLGMPNVRFSTEIVETELGHSGQDKVAFLFSANTSTPLQPVSQVASGGEIARVMLSLKAMISGAVKLPTIIFDEIDTGVSGKIAEQMAQIMQEMGQHERQVISITHLPQIAALGTSHYKVEKEETASGTKSSMRLLTTDERIKEIAQMLSGSEVSDAAIQNAKQLLRL
jgi:DNA repair protein RecN (Recombination protein N)